MDYATPNRARACLKVIATTFEVPCTVESLRALEATLAAYIDQAERDPAPWTAELVITCELWRVLHDIRICWYLPELLGDVREL